METLASIVLKVERNNRIFQFIMPVGAQYGEAYDAAFEIIGEINKMSQKAVDQLKAASEKKEKEEEQA